MWFKIQEDIPWKVSPTKSSILVIHFPSQKQYSPPRNYTSFWYVMANIFDDISPFFFPFCINIAYHAHPYEFFFNLAIYFGDCFILRKELYSFNPTHDPLHTVLLYVSFLSAFTYWWALILAGLLLPTNKDSVTFKKIFCVYGNFFTLALYFIFFNLTMCFILFFICAISSTMSNL